MGPTCCSGGVRTQPQLKRPELCDAYSSIFCEVLAEFQGVLLTVGLACMSET